MSAYLAGLDARIEQLILDLQEAIAAAREAPWAYTALPAARQQTGTTVDPASGSVASWGSVYGAKVALAADTTLQTLVSVTGSGFLEFAAVNGENIAGTVGLAISVDGVSILPLTTGASSTSAKLLVGCGSYEAEVSYGPPAVEFWRVPFRSSLEINAQQSTTTQAAAVLYRYSLAEPFSG